MAHSFDVYLATPIVVGVLLTCQSLDPEYKTTVFFQMSRIKKKKPLSYIQVNSTFMTQDYCKHSSLWTPLLFASNFANFMNDNFRFMAVSKAHSAICC